MTQAIADSTPLFELTGVGVVETDLVTGRFLCANQAFCEMVGYSENELQELTYLALTHPNDKARDETSFRALQAGMQTGGTSLTRVLHKDGSVVWLELSITLVGEGEEIRNITVASDVSERNRQENVLRENHERQAFLLKLSDALRAEPDADAVANRALRMLFEQLQLDRCYVGVYRLADDRGDFTHQLGNDRVPPVPDGVRLSDFPEALRVAFDRTLAIDDVAGTEGLSEGDRRNLAALGMGALIAATLRKGENNPYWSIVAISARPRRWTPGEITLLEEVTERTWAAVERARAEAALHESEVKYRTLFDSMDEGYCIIEVIFDEYKEPVDYRFLEVNAAFERQTGLVNAIGKRMRELAPEHEAYWFETYGRIALTGRAERFEHRAASLGFDYDVYAFRVGEADEHKVAVLFNDVSKRKRIEVALRVSEERLRLTVESIPDYAIFTTDPDGFVTSWNSGAVGVFGYSEDDIIGQDVAILFTPENREAGVPRMESKIAREQGRAKDDRWHLRKDGERFYVNGLVAPLWADATLTGYVKIARDLTRQQEAEEEREMLLEAVQDFNTALEERVRERTKELERSNVRFSQAFALSPISATISTLGRETFLEVNEAFLKLTGYTRDEIIGKDVFELTMWSSREDQQKLEEVHAATQGFRELELQLRNKDGNVHDILLSAEIIRTDGEYGYLKMFYDISDRKQTERELAEALRQVVSDTNWFSQRVMERLGYIRAGEPNKEIVELTGRERQILEHLAKGWGNKNIARDLKLNEQTVRNYISNLYSKLDVHSRAEAIVWARERNIGS